MPRKLILIRHAKSAWDDPSADDHDRVLNDRGRESATAIGRWLAGKGHVPDQVLSSDSARTRETVERVLAELPTEPDVSFLRGLYLPEPQTMLQALRQATGQTVALVAHNPGTAIFAESIVEAAPDHPRFFDYPTAGTLVAEFDTNDWSLVDRGMGRVVDFVVPRDLIG